MCVWYVEFKLCCEILLLLKHSRCGSSYLVYSMRTNRLSACRDREKAICYQLEFENNFANVSTECSSRHQGESERSAKQRCYL